MSSTQLHMRSSYLMESGILDYDFGRCDGHHEMVDLRLRKKSSVPASSIADTYRPADLILLRRRQKRRLGCLGPK
jgi:hypothetical protein